MGRLAYGTGLCPVHLSFGSHSGYNWYDVIFIIPAALRAVFTIHAWRKSCHTQKYRSTILTNTSTWQMPSTAFAGPTSVIINRYGRAGYMMPLVASITRERSFSQTNMLRTCGTGWKSLWTFFGIGKGNSDTEISLHATNRIKDGFLGHFLNVAFVVYPLFLVPWRSLPDAVVVVDKYLLMGFNRSVGYDWHDFPKPVVKFYDVSLM